MLPFPRPVLLAPLMMTGAGPSAPGGGGPPPEAPGVPTSVAVGSHTAAGFSISWSAPVTGGAVSAYRTQVQAAGGDWSSTLVNTTGASPRSITGRDANTEYDVRVRSENVTGNSAWVEVAGVLTLPAAPTGLAATPGDEEVELLWDDVGGLTYKVYRNTANTTVGATLVTSGAAGPGYVDSGLTNDTPYYYFIKATNATGDSAFSAVATATPAAPPGDPDYLDFISRVDAAGTMSTAEKQRFSDALDALKTAGLWDKHVDFHIFGGEFSTCFEKLKGPMGIKALTHDGFDSADFDPHSGLRSDGAHKANTGIIPNAHGMDGTNPRALWVWMTDITGSGIHLGSDGHGYIGWAGNDEAYISGGSNLEIGRTEGLMLLTTDAGTKKSYVDNGLQTSAHGASGASPGNSSVYYVNGYDAANTFIGNNCRVLGYGLCNADLTATDVDNLRQIMNAFVASRVQENKTPASTLQSGDSITQGYTASDAAHQWTDLLADAKGWTLYNDGISGSRLISADTKVQDGYLRTSYISRILFNPLGVGEFVQLNFGANDVNVAGFLPATYKTHLEFVTQEILDVGGYPAADLLISSPNYQTFFTEDGSRDVMLEVVQACVDVAADKSTRYGAVWEGTDGVGGILSDGIHLNDAGHQLKADIVIPAWGTLAAPVNTVLPTITGTAEEGSTVTFGNGSWTGVPGPTYVRQLQRYTALDVFVEDIVGATGIDYEITSDDVGFKLRLEVTAANASGSVSALSALTAVVTVPDVAPPLEGNLIQWADASDAGTLYDATSGGSLVAADGLVARWEDKSPSGYNFIQATSGSRFTRKTSIQNGRDVLRGNADGMTASAVALASGECSVYMVLELTTASNYGCLAAYGVLSAGEWNLIQALTSGRPSITAGATNNGAGMTSGGVTACGATTNLQGAGFVIISGIIRTDDLFILRQNGRIKDYRTASFSMAASADMHIGYRNGSLGSVLDIGEWLVYDVAHTAAQSRQVEEYLGTKWGITLESDPAALITFPVNGAWMPHYGDNVPVGMYQDASCILPAVTLNDPVGAYRDETGKTFFVSSQSSATKWGLLKFPGGVPAILFDNTDDGYASNTTLPSPYSIGVAAEQPGNANRIVTSNTDNRLIAFNRGSNSVYIGANIVASNLPNYGGTLGVVGSGSDPGTGILTCGVSDRRYYANGIDVSEANPSAADWNQVDFGHSGVFGEVFDGYLYGFFCNNAEWDSTQIAAAHTLLASLLP
jgi:lysophospholipase L1-like esterase